MEKWIVKLNKAKFIGFLIAAMILIECIFIFSLGPELKAVSGQKMMDMIYYNNTIFYDTLHEYGQEGLLVYNKMQVVDIFFPLVYSLLFAVLLYRFNFKYWRMAFLVAGMDYIENIGIRFFIISQFKHGPSLLYVFSFMKFLGFTWILLMLFLLWIKKKSRKAA